MRKFLAAALTSVFSFCIYAHAEAGMSVTSPSFKNYGFMPEKFSYTGGNINPELIIDGIPERAKTLAIIMDDPDAPRGTWVHWIVFNIPPQRIIREGSSPGGIGGLNSFRQTKYAGPHPPNGTHRYFFKIYALDTAIIVHHPPEKQELLNRMKGHILAEAQLTGLYKR